MDELISQLKNMTPKNKEEYNKMEKIKNLINELEFEIKNYFIEYKNNNIDLVSIKNEINEEKKIFNKLLFLYYFFDL